MSHRDFPPDTVGDKMITTFPRATIGARIGEVEQMLVDKIDTFATIDYVYVVDGASVLQGVVSIKELHSSGKDAAVDDVMEKDLIVADPLTPQEEIVYLALSNGIKAVPVVDQQGAIIGIVPYDSILQIFNEEVRQDTFRFGGIFHKLGDEITTVKSSASVMIKTRIPWLTIGVLGGAVTASLVSHFEPALNAMLALASFVPVLAYLSDAVGTQSETLTVRSMALNPKLSLKAYFSRELVVALFLAVACGLMIALVAMLGWGNWALGLIVGCSLFLSMIAAVLISTGLPFLLRSVRLDPAVAAGPFATMISDVVTMTIYLGIASLWLRQCGLLYP